MCPSQAAESPQPPALIAIQAAADPSAEARAVRLAAMIRDIPVRRFADGEALPEDALPVGTVRFVLDAIERLGHPAPPVINYPDCLMPWARRTLSRMRLGEARTRAESGQILWVKPDTHDKRFETGDPALVGHEHDDCPVWASSRVEWLCEWRYYVVNSRLTWAERYDPEGADGAPEPDIDGVGAMIRALARVPDTPRAYGLDVGVLANGETALIEVNDGYALGYYGPVSSPHAKLYLELLHARWREMAEPGVCPPKITKNAREAPGFSRGEDVKPRSSVSSCDP